MLQVRDLSEKVETLRIKRMQDKERIKDFEKTKLQLEQLVEFKTKVMESQVSGYNKFLKKINLCKYRRFVLIFPFDACIFLIFGK